MIKSNVVQLIFSLNKNEQTALREFVFSDYVNKEINVRKLLEYIYMHLDDKKVSKKEAFAYIYQDKTYNYGLLRYLNSRLLKKVKAFFKVNKVLSDDVRIDIAFLEKLRANHLETLYINEEAKVLKKITQKHKSKSEDYHNVYLFNMEMMHFYAERKRIETKYLSQMHEYLDVYYFIEKLKIACTSINQKKIYKTEFDQTYFESLIKYLKKSNVHQSAPLLNIYFNAYQMLVTNDGAFYNALKESFKNDYYDIAEVKDAFLLTINFCIQQLNLGMDFYENEIFDLYRLGIDNAMILNEGKLSPITYSNVVTVGLRLKKFKEVETFIDVNRNLLVGSSANDYYLLNRSKLLFEMGEFKEVISLYNQKPVNEVLLNIQTRILQFKAFYELGELNLCENILNSIRALIGRKGVLAYHKDVFKNTIVVLKQLLNVHVLSKKRILEFKQKIEAIKSISEKQWIIDKVNEL